MGGRGLMADMTLVRQPGALTEAETDTLRALLFRFVDGLTEVDRKRWRNWWGKWKRTEAGEMATIKSNRPRSLPYHKRHMLIESRVFDAQERIDDFRQFRNWLKVGSGFCDWLAGPKGGVIPVPKSIDFESLEDRAFEEAHAEMMRFLRGAHAARFLWPHLKDGKAEEMMDSVLYEFNE